ncbi:MAG: hypothetical protein ACREHC_03945 [Candidatus Levyibacteriota bacterium]
MDEDKPSISIPDLVKKLGFPTEDSKARPPIIPHDKPTTDISPRGGFIQPHSRTTFDISDTPHVASSEDELREALDTFQPRPLLPDDEYADLLTKLRPSDKPFPDIVDLPEEGDLAAFIKEQLAALGYDQKQVVVRNVHRDRLGIARASGTDRDRNSQLTNMAQLKYEEIAMAEQGLLPKSNRVQVLYANRVDLSNPDARIQLNDRRNVGILVYAPEAIEFIHPTRHPDAALNGFAMFRDPRIGQRALLAIISPISQGEIARLPTSSTAYQNRT